MVGGQSQHGQLLAQLFSPIGQLCGQATSLGKPFALPSGKIGVLDGQRRERRILAGGKSGIEGCQFGQQYPVDRITVKNNVVEGEEQPVFRVAQMDEQSAKERTAGEIKGPERIFERETLGLGLSFRWRGLAEINPPDERWRCRMDNLNWFTIGQSKTGSPCFVAADDLT